jgi:hypothetical protein
MDQKRTPRWDLLPSGRTSASNGRRPTLVRARSRPLVDDIYRRDDRATREIRDRHDERTV